MRGLTPFTKLLGDLDCDFGFTGHYYHAGSDLHLTLYRAYDQELGRWLSADPIGENGGLNLYAYVGNNSTNSRDRLGLQVDINLNPGGFDSCSSTSSDVRKEFAKNAPDNELAITVYGHGSPESMVDQRESYKGKVLTPEMLSAIIKARPDFPKTKRVILYSCNTGRGNNSFAEKLAKILGIEVLGGNRYHIPYKNGNSTFDDMEHSPPGTPPGTPGEGRGGFHLFP